MSEGFSQPQVSRFLVGLLTLCVVAGCAVQPQAAGVVRQEVVSVSSPHEAAEKWSLDQDAFPISSENTFLESPPDGSPSSVPPRPNNLMEGEHAAPEEASDGGEENPPNELGSNEDNELSCPPPIPMVSPPYRPDNAFELEDDRWLDQWWQKTMEPFYSDFARHLVGLPETFAQDCVAEAGAVWRIIERDGEHFMVTKDYQVHRINAVVSGGVVVEARTG